MKKTYLWTAMLCTAIAFSACKSNKAGQDTASEAKTEEAVIPGSDKDEHNADWAGKATGIMRIGKLYREVIKTNTVASALPDTYGVK